MKKLALVIVIALLLGALNVTVSHWVSADAGLICFAITNVAMVLITIAIVAYDSD